MINAINMIFAQVLQCSKVSLAVQGHLMSVISNFMTKPVSTINISKMRLFFTNLRTRFIKNKDVDYYDTKYAYKVCFALIVANRCPHLLLWDVDSLLAVYPEFSTENVSELVGLLAFRNFMHVSLHFTQGKNHKGELLYVCGCLCGCILSTGGGQRPFTTRRCLIFDREVVHVEAMQQEAARRLCTTGVTFTAADGDAGDDGGGGTGAAAAIATIDAIAATAAASFSSSSSINYRYSSTDARILAAVPPSRTFAVNSKNANWCRKPVG
jgi:hypothetical protein